MPKLVKNSVSRTLITMAIPMLAGTFAMNTYNLTDTWFVSRLGTSALAAMSFTFPVVMLLRFITRGVGTGVMTVVAHALGRKEHETAARLTTHALLLAFLFACIISATGLMTTKPLFTRLGAGEDVLNLVEDYMRIWYYGMVIMVIQMMVGDVIIGSGNTKAASFLIVGGTGLNFIFDPVLIFGFFGFPRMGISGAALATVLSQAVMLIVAIYILHKKYHLLSLSLPSPRQILTSWKQILHIGVPSTLSSILNPISSAVVIKIVADFGRAAVAACGVASRIEMFAFMIPMTVGISLVPFVAQNYGAGRFDRIESARKGTTSFALAFGFVIAIVFFATAHPLAKLFSEDTEVVNILIRYICITCFGYGFLEAHRYAGFFMTGIHKPVSAAILNTIRVIVLLIPLSFIGAKALGLSGVFWGRLTTDVLAGIIGIIWFRKILQPKRFIGKGSKTAFSRNRLG